MNTTKIFFRNVSILFDYLKNSFKDWIRKSRKVPKITIRNFFKISNSPKRSMQLAFVISILFAVYDEWILSIIFFILYIVLKLYKIWVGGEPIKWYREKYLVK